MFLVLKWIRSFFYQLFNSFWKRKPLLLAIFMVIMFSIVVLQYSFVNVKSSSIDTKKIIKLSNSDISANSFVSNNLTQRAVLPKPYPVKSENELKDSGEDWQPLKLPSGESSDPEIKRKRDTIKEMMKFAWDNYVKYAWGENELKPISKKGHSPGIFGKTKLGATIVDAMDTLFIMGMKDEFDKGRKWIHDNLVLDHVNSDISVFETTIRYIGGLLTCYAFTKDKLFLEKADHIASKLLPAFNTQQGIPYSLINPKTGFAKNYVWAPVSSSVLSEIGTLHLEFVYLSDLTNNGIYKEKVMTIRNYLQKSLKKTNGLYCNFINPKTGKCGQNHYSLGALGDSFYEYLLKAWIQSDGKDIDARKMYDEAMAAIEKYLLKRSKGGLYYFSDLKFDKFDNLMGHLACFSGGLLALGAQSLSNSEQLRVLKIAKEITHTCHESYKNTPTNLGPECFRFTDGNEAKTNRISEKYYILRPETFESYFYLWRFTKDTIYRKWAWEAVEAIQKHCRVEAGFSGLRDVYDLSSAKDDVQQSFLLAETFKYLYLIFSEDNLLPFNEWVFNTEAHPLPIKGRNPAYPNETPMVEADYQPEEEHEDNKN